MTETKDKKWVFIVLIAICALLWGLSFFGTKVALTYMDTMQVLCLRWIIAAIIFALLAAFKVIKINFKGKPVKFIMLLGLVQPCIYSVFETTGIDLTTTSESSIMIATIPLMVLVLGRVVLKRKFSRRTVFAIVMAFVGVFICIAFAPNFSLGGKGLGYLALFGAVTTGATYNHMSNKAADNFSPLEITFMMAIAGGVVFNILNFTMGYGVTAYKMMFGNLECFIAILFLGVGCSCICYIIYNLALGKLPTAIASNMVANSTTAVGVLSGVIFAGDPFGWYTIVGLGLTLAGIWITSSKV